MDPQNENEGKTRMTFPQEAEEKPAARDRERGKSSRRVTKHLTSSEKIFRGKFGATYH